MTILPTLDGAVYNTDLLRGDTTGAGGRLRGKRCNSLSHYSVFHYVHNCTPVYTAAFKLVRNSS